MNKSLAYLHAVCCHHHDAASILPCVVQQYADGDGWSLLVKVVRGAADLLLLFVGLPKQSDNDDRIPMLFAQGKQASHTILLAAWVHMTIQSNLR
jgi:hypothetical protein